MAAGDLVILTGAGVSAESGLPTFRGAGGLWENRRLEEVATPEAFEADPVLVQRFYNERRRALLSPAVTPNPAHTALARLEREWPGGFLLVTQNVDDLHERAGSRKLLHMHGQLLEVRCSTTGRIFPWKDDVTPGTCCACCGRRGTLRPNVVWFGEMPLGLDRIYAALGRCALFVSIGTSGQVHPAAGFVRHVRMHTTARTVEINLEPSEGASLFAERRIGPAGRLVPAFVEELLPSGSGRV
jgi:NAD-dependent deacetylase